MEGLSNIYTKNLIFTVCVFIMSIALPYSHQFNTIKPLLLIIILVLYAYMGKLLVDIIKKLGQKQTSVKELKFLFITLAVLCAGVYFFIAMVDQKEMLISGLRVIKPHSYYNMYSISGFYDYFFDVFSTYLNSIYYSIMVMATLGDSKIAAESGVSRLIIAFEVGTTLTITIFKIGEYYSEHSSQEAKASEERIINHIKNIDKASSKTKNAKGIFERLKNLLRR
ncbi:hypothetical protein ACIPR9_00015 [Pectobacterium punjabense]|uniref:hypothetical protein n=1 Tax=Pectobacterium punjabense TaxID=2108399 RepID=UPI00381AEA02